MISSISVTANRFTEKMCYNKIYWLIAKIGTDKIAHFFGCAFVVLALGRFIHPAIAATVVALLAVAKELLDKSIGGPFDWHDLLADALGIIISSLILWL